MLVYLAAPPAFCCVCRRTLLMSMGSVVISATAAPTVAAKPVRSGSLMVFLCFNTRPLVAQRSAPTQPCARGLLALSPATPQA
eukprot:scaffold2584_cov231-Pinguiococcus_pyrenoidosus.AAC.3